MTSTDIVNLVAQIASIGSFFVSLWTLKTVYAIRTSMSTSSSSRSTFAGGQSVQGNQNMQAGGNIDGQRQGG